MSPQAWRDNIFLPSLQEHWADPDELYRLIMSGLNDGFASDLLPAAEHLLTIDAMPERSHTVLGIALMKNGQLDAAEATLRAGLEKVGMSGILLLNLAKVFAERGDDARVDATLWQSLQTNPNLDNGLMWWLALRNEQGGDAGYVEGLHTAAALPGSWRAQLWLARHHLEQDDTTAARALHEQVLAGSMFDRQALTMMSGDLGSHGLLAEMLELVGPVFDEHEHDPMTGLNLLRACQVLSKIKEGHALLSRMYALNLPPIKPYLDQFAQAFEDMERDAARAAI